MKKLLILFIILIPLVVWAGNIAQPPVIQDKVTKEYLKTIADNWNKLEVVTSNPDGSRSGRLGEMILLNSSGTYYLEICTSSPDGTVWKGTQLSDTP